MRHFFLIFAMIAMIGMPMVATAQSGPTAHAILIAKDEVVLSSQMSGRIADLPFKEGQSFKKGDVLAAFSCEILQAEEAVAVATVEAAKAELKNAQNLDRLKAAGALDLVLAETAVRHARAELNVARSRKNLCKIIAPFDGVVLSHEVRRYESMDAKTPIIRIGGNGPLRVSIIAPAEWLSWLNTKVDFEFHLADQTVMVPGHIDRIGASVDAASQTVKVEGFLEGNDHSGLLPGQGGIVRFVQPGGQSQ